MQCTCIFILLMNLIIIQTIFSFDAIDDKENENKFDEIRQIPSLPYYPLLPVRKKINTPECLSKIQLSNMLNRNRRASISRPYFHHWRTDRENSRYSAKTSLAFSPRLGKRVYESDNVDLDTFLDHLQGKKIYIVYEDPIQICLSQSISDPLIQQILGKTHAKRRDQNMEETRERQPIGKHPILFRYRLG